MDPVLLQRCMRGNSDIIESIQFGKRTLHFLKQDKDQDNKQEEYLRIIGKDKVDAVVNLMLTDTDFRNFMLVNLQNVFEQLGKKRDLNSPKYRCIFRKEDGLDFFQIVTPDYIGLISDVPTDSFVNTIGSQSAEFIVDFTDQFKLEISYLRHGSIKHASSINPKTQIVDQVKKLLEVGSFTRDEIIISNNSVLVHNPKSSEKVRAFFVIQ